MTKLRDLLAWLNESTRLYTPTMLALAVAAALLYLDQPVAAAALAGFGLLNEVALRMTTCECPAEQAEQTT